MELLGPGKKRGPRKFANMQWFSVVSIVGLWFAENV